MIGTGDSSLMIDAIQPVELFHPLNQGLVNWWYGLPNAVGGLRYDDLLNRSPGTMVNGARWCTTPMGGGGIVTSSTNTQYVSAASPTWWAPGTSGDFTLAIWARIEPLSDTSRMLMCNASGSGAAGIELLYGLGGTSGRVSVRVGSTGAASFDGSYHDSVWRRYVGVRAGGQLSLYVNGVLVAGPTADSNNATASNAMNLGARNGAIIFNGPGQLADAATWSRGLSASEVWADYCESRAGRPNTLRRWSRKAWLFSGSAVNNYSLTADAGSYTLSGQDTGLKSTRLVIPAAGSYSLAGQDAALKSTRVVTADSGSFTLTGQSASLLFGRRLNAGDLTDGLIACYRFDGNLVDSSGQGNDLSGLSQYTTGKLGQGLTGINTATCAAFTGFNNTGLDQCLAVSFWCKSTTADGLGGGVNFYLSGNPFLNINFSPQGNDAHEIVVEYDSVAALNGTDFLPENTWTHVAIVRDRDSRIYLYRNGVLFDDVASTGPLLSLSSGLHLDVLPIRDDPFVLDQLMVWRKPLSSTDVLALYASGNGLDPTTTSTSAYVVTGQAASLLLQRVVTAGPGSYTLTGQSATLTGPAFVAGPGIRAVVPGRRLRAVVPGRRLRAVVPRGN